MERIERFSNIVWVTQGNCQSQVRPKEPLLRATVFLGQWDVQEKCVRQAVKTLHGLSLFG